MNISDEAVEAAASAAYEAHVNAPWESSPYKPAWLHQARLSLEAAAPHLMAARGQEGC
jgi:hypothetical protein